MGSSKPRKARRRNGPIPRPFRFWHGARLRRALVTAIRAIRSGRLPPRATPRKNSAGSTRNLSAPSSRRRMPCRRSRWAALCAAGASSTARARRTARRTPKNATAEAPSTPSRTRTPPTCAAHAPRSARHRVLTDARLWPQLKLLESSVHLQEDLSQQGHAITMIAADVYGASLCRACDAMSRAADECVRMPR